MSIILGFGNKEKEFRSSIESVIYCIVKDVFDRSDDKFDFITPEEKKEIEEQIAILKKKYMDESEEYKDNPEKPERYTYFRTSVAVTAWEVFVGVNYHHINTKHPMSPDGTAMMQVKESYWYDRSERQQTNREDTSN